MAYWQSDEIVWKGANDTQPCLGQLSLRCSLCYSAAESVSPIVWLDLTLRIAAPEFPKVRIVVGVASTIDSPHQASEAKNPKGPCTQILVYNLASTYSPYGSIGPKVYTTWVHGPLGEHACHHRVVGIYGTRHAQLPELT